MRENLKALTSLRFFAAAAIVIHHTSWYFGYGRDLEQIYPLDLGVSFFFVLSGFVLYYSYPVLPSSRDKVRFIAARIARIWPAHVATLFMVLVFLPYPWSGRDESGLYPPILENLFLLQSWALYPHYFFSFNGVSWSISTEMFFYAMFPLLIWHWDRSKWLKLGGAAMLVGGCVWCATALQLTPLKVANTASLEGVVTVFPPARLLEFTIGIFTAWAWLKYHQLLVRFANVLQIAAVLLVVTAIPLINHVLLSMTNRGENQTAATKWLAESGCAPIFAILIFSLALPRGILMRVLSWKILVVLGEISFSLYLTHQILMRSLVKAESLSNFGRIENQLCIYWLAVLMLSYSLWTFIEMPCRRSLMARFDAFWPERQNASEEKAPGVSG